MPGFDETDEEIRYRVRDPDDYDDYGQKDIAIGVTAVFGHNKENGNWELQSLRFDKEKFSLSQAEAWVSAHAARPRRSGR